MQTTHDAPPVTSSAGWRVLSRSADRYMLGFAQTREEVLEAQVLRFQVFNLELDEGLAESWALERDEDPFDAVCDHLLVREATTGRVVGTYRLQTGLGALVNRGYYSEQEFDLSPFEAIRTQVIEAGRACVHKEHRNVRVLATLWRGIATYVARHRARYLLGCSSINTQDEAAGIAMGFALAQGASSPGCFRTQPRPEYACRATGPLPTAPRPPPLLRAYLSLGAVICAPPAIDRQFQTIDFLALLDVQDLNPDAAALYLGSEWKSSFVVS